MSRTTFFNKWKSLTGEAPKFFIYRIRMEKARELLESGKYSVNVVPEMIGLKNLKNFRHKYKEYFGITPSESIIKNNSIRSLLSVAKVLMNGTSATAFLQKNILFLFPYAVFHKYRHLLYVRTP